MANDRNFLKHETDASNDPRVIRLERAHGLAGYAVYFKIREYLATRGDEDGALAFDVDVLTVATRCDDAALVESVVKNFGLFEVCDDGRFHCPEQTATLRERQRVAAACSEAGKRGRGRPRKTPANGPSCPAVASKPAATPSEPTNHKNAPTTPIFDEYDDANFSPPVDSNGEIVVDAAQKIESVRKIWNEEAPPAKKTRIMIPGNTPTGSDALETANLFTPDEIRDAFRAAFEDDGFPWTFKDAVKPANIERLRAKRTLPTKKENRDEPEFRTATDGADFWKSLDASPYRNLYQSF